MAMELPHHHPMGPSVWDPPAAGDEPPPNDPSPPAPAMPTTADPQAASGPFHGLFDGEDGGGQPLEAGMRHRAESSLGVPLAHVRVHRGPAAAVLLADRGVEALAVGSDIVAGPQAGDGSPILAHEVAHAAAQSGATGANTIDPAVDATHEQDADLGAIAVLSGVRHRMAPMGMAAEQHYASNEHAWLGDTAAGSEKFMIQGVPLTSGDVNALADYFGSLEAMQDPKNKAALEECAHLLELERKDPGSVPTARWDKATGGEYSKLSLANSDHFAASDPNILPSSGTQGENNASTWDQGHREALQIAAGRKPGDVEKARLTNAFAEHYLCDAFSAGHLFNKDDAMALGEQNLAALPEAELKRLLDHVADPVFETNRDIIQQYEVDVPLLGWTTPNWIIFRAFVEKAYALKPDLLLNALVVTAHDDLSENGVWVENDAHPPWLVRGDEHLADGDQGATQQYCMEALEVGRANVAAAAAQGDGANIEELIARVQGLFPRLTQRRGANKVRDTVEGVMTPGTTMEKNLIARLNGEIRMVMEEATKEEPPMVRRKRPGDGVGETPDPNLPADPELPTGSYYYVQPGDWLSKLAERFYGDPMKYPILFDANSDPAVAKERQTDVISDPDVIEEGWRLFIPAAPPIPGGRYGPPPTP